jgi:hypothetical protein
MNASSRYDKGASQQRRTRPSESIEKARLGNSQCAADSIDARAPPGKSFDSEIATLPPVPAARVGELP